MGYSVTFYANVRDQRPLSGVRCIDRLGGHLDYSNLCPVSAKSGHSEFGNQSIEA